MAGLENYLSTLKDNAGMAGGYQQGIRDRASLDTTLAGLEQQRAQTQRYTGETPSYLQKAGAQARTAELANVQGEADLAAGVPQAKAGQSMQEAQLKAKQAEQALKQMDSKTKLQMMDQMAKEVESFNQLGLQALQFSGSTQEAIQRMAEQYPDITKDPSFTQWAKQYGSMPREQALNAFKFEMQKYASGIATTREKFQTEALQEDQKQQGRMELGAQQGQYGLQEAQTRATAAGEGKENTTMAIRRLSAIIADPNTTEEQKLAAEYELTAQLKFGQQRESSPLGEQFGRTKEKELPPRPGSTSAGTTAEAGSAEEELARRKAAPRTVPVSQQSQTPRKLNTLEEIRSGQNKKLQSVEAAIQAIASKKNPTREELDRMNQLIKESTAIRTNMGL